MIRPSPATLSFRAGSSTRRALALAIVAAAILLSSCDRREGWGLVLWSPPGSPVSAGQVVPVYFKSNITKTWAIGVPDSKEKAELELWRLELHRSKRAAEAAAKAYNELSSVMAICARDGLVLREKPDNTADQTYRLRIDQEIKLLQEVEGVEVSTAGKKLEGTWYLALADDGTRGYIFSNQLLLWDTLVQERPKATTEAPALDARIGDLFEVAWRPDYYAVMEANGRFDLSLYQPRFGFFTDPINKTIRVEHPAFSKTYRYANLVKNEEGAFPLPDGALLHFTANGRLVLTPAEEDITPKLVSFLKNGMLPLDDAAAKADAEAFEAARSASAEKEAITLTFVRQKKDPRQVIANEERRRLNLLAQFAAAGERFESDGNGSLVITATGRATWTEYEALVPDTLPADAGGIAKVSLDLQLDPSIAGLWQGGFTFTFEGGKKPVVRFLYREENGELLLALLPPQPFKNGLVAVEPVGAPLAFRRAGN